MAQLHLFVSFVHLCHLFCLAVWVPVLLGKPAGLVAEDALLGPVLREGLPVLCRPVVASGSLFAWADFWSLACSFSALSCETNNPHG